MLRNPLVVPYLDPRLHYHLISAKIAPKAILFILTPSGSAGELLPFHKRTGAQHAHARAWAEVQPQVLSWPIPLCFEEQAFMTRELAQ